MRLLKANIENGTIESQNFDDNVPPYAILSHTWGSDDDEVSFADIENQRGHDKAGFAKIQFCAEQARKLDGLEHIWIWVDTCCIDKNNHNELSEAITSMFRYYRDAIACYVYLSDVSTRCCELDSQHPPAWEASFRASRWFTRGWTLQELLAPNTVEFFSCEKDFLGDKSSLAQQIHEITKIPVSALLGTPLQQFSIGERMQWARLRQTKKREDRAYCLLGIFDVFMPLIYGEGDHAFVRLQKEINARFESSKRLAHTRWVVSRSANPLFTGREEILQNLESTIRDAVDCPWNRPQCRIVISGIGGQGKSEICLQLARRLRQFFGAILWVDLDSKTTAEKSFLEIADKLSITASTSTDVCVGIANLKYSWLLVLDNADEPDIDYQNYFPDGQLGVIIMTTRNDECHQYSTGEVVALEGLHDTDAQELLLKAARVQPSQHYLYADQAKTVVNLLQSHSLALIQAGAYVARGQCTMAEYPRLYQQQRQHLLTFRPLQAQSRYRDVYATFEVSMKMLVAMDSQAACDAIQLLPLLAMCGANQFPVQVFEDAWQAAKTVPRDRDEAADDENVTLLRPWHVARLPSLLDLASSTWNSFRLMEAVALLKTFSLISNSLNDDLSYLSMHPLVHAWARDRLDESGRHRSWVQMGCIIAFVIWRDHWPSQVYSRSFEVHIKALTDWPLTEIFSSEPRPLIARIIVKCGWRMNCIRADNHLFKLMQRTFVHLGLDRQNVDQAWMGLYDLLADNLLDCGSVKEAVILLEQLVNIREQTLAEDHYDLVKSQRALARAYRKNGKVKKAVALSEKVVRITERTLAKDSSSLLSAQHDLAQAYRANGEFEKAAVLLQNVVTVKEKAGPKDDQGLLMSQHELAGVYIITGRVKEAIALLEMIVKKDEQSLREDHPHRLDSADELALAYKKDRQTARAVTLLEYVVKLREQSHKEDHPDRLGSQHNLARLYKKEGRTMEAIELLKRTVEVRERSLDENHPKRLKAQYNLAKGLWDIGDRATALEIMTHVANTERRVLEEDDPYRKGSEKWQAYMTQALAKAQQGPSSDFLPQATASDLMQQVAKTQHASGPSINLPTQATDPEQHGQNASGAKRVGGN